MWLKDSEKILWKWEDGAKKQVFWFWFAGLAFVAPFWILLMLLPGEFEGFPTQYAWVWRLAWVVAPLSLPVTKTVRCHRRGGIRVAPWRADPAFADQITRQVRHLALLVAFWSLAVCLEESAEGLSDTLARSLRFLQSASYVFGIWIFLGPLSRINKAAKAEWEASQGSADA